MSARRGGWKVALRRRDRIVRELLGMELSTAADQQDLCRKAILFLSTCLDAEGPSRSTDQLQRADALAAACEHVSNLSSAWALGEPGAAPRAWVRTRLRSLAVTIEIEQRKSGKATGHAPLLRSLADEVLAELPPSRRALRFEEM